MSIENYVKTLQLQYEQLKDVKTKLEEKRDYYRDKINKLETEIRNIKFSLNPYRGEVTVGHIRDIEQALKRAFKVIHEESQEIQNFIPMEIESCQE